MKITFLGAAHQVTGSKTLIEWMDNRYCLVDYGMEQGENDFVMADLPIAASSVEYVFLTHAHIDHSGMLPLLYKQGFRGKIYATAETTNLCSIMLADSAHIQETDASNETKKNLRHSGTVVEPLYTMDDAAATMEFFRPCAYGEMIMVDEGLTARFTDAGHLLGSAFLELFLEDGELKALYTDRPFINWEDIADDRKKVSVISTGVESISFLYADFSSDVSDEWKDRLFWRDSWETEDSERKDIPLAIQIRVKWQDGREESWLRRTMGNSYRERYGTFELPVDNTP